MEDTEKKALLEKIELLEKRVQKLEEKVDDINGWVEVFMEKLKLY